jgi:YggT family protein
MLINAIEFLLNTLLGLFTLALLLRCYLQLTNAPFHNPFSQAVVTMTAFAVRPARRIIPSWAWLDTASLALAYLTQLLLLLAVLWLRDYPILVAGPQVYLALLAFAALGIIKLSIYIFLYAVLLLAVLGWVNPHTPLAPLLDSLTSPLLRPLRRLIQPRATLDLTPLVVFILAELLLMLLVMPLEQQLRQIL